MGDVLIIGAGAAGLAAAEVLARENVGVTLLEARERIGGRIFTATSHTGDLPIELGAEFVHGAKNDVWQVVRAAKLETQEVPGQHWQIVDGLLQPGNQSWAEIEKILSKINTKAPDLDFCSFLDGIPGLSSMTRRFALDYVEGFHAADSARVSIHSLARAEAAAEADEGTRQFRLAKGYRVMLDWFWDRTTRLGVQAHLGTIVDSIQWERGQVEVEARTRDGRERFSARQALVTLPLGVLQEQGVGGVVFIPRITPKEAAIRALAMGHVIKLTFQFRARFWPIENFGFIHALGSLFPTWWSDERGLLLTAWAGGPRALQLSREGSEAVQAAAVRVLADIFRTDPKRIADLIIGVYHHDWTHDPFALGAYSYTPAGADQMAAQLGAPLDGTLFFAGEATDLRGEQGTVHAALASGQRAAKEMLTALKKANSGALA